MNVISGYWVESFVNSRKDFSATTDISLAYSTGRRGSAHRDSRNGEGTKLLWAFCL
jgi:hypothetical protein